MYINDWPAAYPQVLLAPGLAERIKTLKYDAVVDAQSMLPLAGDIDWLLFDAMPLLNEIILYHRDSRSLMLTDTSFNIHHTDWSPWGIHMRFSGAYKKFDLSRLVRFAARDRLRARELIERMLEWEFERIIVAHGEILNVNAKQHLQQAFNWC